MAASLLDLVRARWPALADPEALVVQVTEARATWPAIAIEPERFLAFLGEREVGTEIHISDLYVACGCVDGAPAAIAAFDQTCLPVIDRAVQSAGATAAELADLRQVVRARLLVPPASESGDEPPRITGYTGRGGLGSWVRVVATREAQRLLARERRTVAAADDEIAGMLAPDDDPELGYLKRVYRAEFKLAFAGAIDALADRDRLLLQQHALDGLSIDHLAAFHKVHRATAARWLEAARKAVLDGTRKQLIDRLQLGRDELESLMRLIASQLDVSLPRLLRR